MADLKPADCPPFKYHGFDKQGVCINCGVLQSECEVLVEIDHKGLPYEMRKHIAPIYERMLKAQVERDQLRFELEEALEELDMYKNNFRMAEPGELL